MPDEEVARHTRRTPEAVRIYRTRRGIANPNPKVTPERVWNAGEIKLLGRWKDSEVGRRIGCPDYLVQRKRVRLGIPAWRPMPEYKLWTPAEDKLVGTMPDEKLAAQLSRTENAVKLRRRKFRIPPFNSQSGR